MYSFFAVFFILLFPQIFFLRVSSLCFHYPSVLESCPPFSTRSLSILIMFILNSQSDGSDNLCYTWIHLTLALSLQNISSLLYQAMYFLLLKASNDQVFGSTQAFVWHLYFYLAKRYAVFTVFCICSDQGIQFPQVFSFCLLAFFISHRPLLK